MELIQLRLFHRMMMIDKEREEKEINKSAAKLKKNNLKVGEKILLNKVKHGEAKMTRDQVRLVQVSQKDPSYNNLYLKMAT